MGFSQKNNNKQTILLAGTPPLNILVCLGVIAISRILTYPQQKLSRHLSDRKTKKVNQQKRIQIRFPDVCAVSHKWDPSKEIL